MALALLEALVAKVKGLELQLAQAQHGFGRCLEVLVPCSEGMKVKDLELRIAQVPHGFGVAGGACPTQRGHEGERPGAPIGQAQHGFGVAGGACPMQRGHEGERPGAPIAQAQHGFGVAGGACPMLRGHEDERPGSPAAQAPHGFLPMTGQIWLWHEEQQWVSANLVACLGPGKEGGSRSSFNCIFLHHAMQCKVA